MSMPLHLLAPSISASENAIGPNLLKNLQQCEPVRIGFVCFQAFQRGGIRTYTRNLLNGIVASGHEVVLFAPPPAVGMDTGLDPAVRVEPVEVPPLPLMPA